MQAEPGDAPEASARLLALVAALALGCASAGSIDELRVLARTHAEAGRHPEASVVIEEAVSLSPDDVGLRREAAGMATDAADPGRALEHLEYALRFAPDDAELWVDVAELERERANLSDAYVAYRRATELAPDNLRAVSGLALVADQLGFEDEARDAYGRWNELSRRAK